MSGTRQIFKPKRHGERQGREVVAAASPPVNDQAPPIRRGGTDLASVARGRFKKPIARRREAYCAAMRIAAFCLLVALVASRPIPAKACTCAPLTPAEAAAEARSIFEGRVLSVEREDGELRVLFKVVQAWRGVRATRAVVLTQNNSARCGYGFAVGETYLVYTEPPSRDGEPETTGLCSRTRRIAEAEEDLAHLGAGVTPAEPDDETTLAPPVQAPPPLGARSGGCASCAVTPRAQGRAWWLGGLAALAWLRRRRISSCRRP